MEPRTEYFCDSRFTLGMFRKQCGIETTANSDFN